MELRTWIETLDAHPLASGIVGGCIVLAIGWLCKNAPEQLRKAKRRRGWREAEKNPKDAKEWFNPPKGE